MVGLKRTYRKVILREVRFSLSRFLAIFAIVALGVGFLAGLLAATPDMRLSVDDYYDRMNIMDVRVLSTLGLSEEDIAAIRQADGVEQVEPGYTADVLTNAMDAEDVVTRVHSLPAGGSALNQIKLVAGRLPEKPGECVMLKTKTLTGVEEGDVIPLSAENDDLTDVLAVEGFTVVGLVETPYYMSIEKETSTVGAGHVQLTLYAGEDSFAYPAYTEANVLVKGAKALNAFTDEYEAAVDTVQNALEDLGKTQAVVRFEEVKGEAEDKLADGKEEYDKAKAEADEKLADARGELEDGRRELADGEKALADAKKKLSDGEKELTDGKAALADAKRKLADGEKELADQRAAYAAEIADKEKALREGEDKLTAGKAALADAKKTLDETAAQIAQAEKTIAYLLSIGQTEQAAALQAQLDEQRPAYEAGLAAYDQQAGTLAASEKELTAGKAALAAGKAQAEKAFAAAQKELDDGAAEIARNEKKLADAQKELDDGRAEIAANEKKLTDARQKLTDGQAEYDKAKAEADEKLADAKADIEDAEKKIADISEPEWYVLDRNTNVSFASFGSNATKVEAIAKVFPIFFFLVAALVALTTMTRMVEEERTQIGVLKALGYTRGAIAFKYLLYAGAASVLGSVFGLLVGFQVFPMVIWNAYRILYTLPELFTPFNVPYALAASLSAIACTMLATLAACMESLKENPARLMLPRAPKAGKRVFLERITPLWSRMKFTHKVTARNLIRYKKRFFMTVIGIAGCTALLLTGFGLRDSIGDIVGKQFGELYQYNLTASFKDEDAPRADETVKAVLEDKSRVTDYLMTYQESGDLYAGNKTTEATLYVPESTSRLPDFIVMRERKSGKAVPFDGSGVLLTEKQAEALGVKAGDTLRVRNADGKSGEFRLAGIIENYVQGALYIPRELYEAAFGAPAFTTLIGRTAGNTQADRDAVSAALLKSDQVQSAMFTDDIKGSFADMVSNIDYIVIVLIISAAALAFVVLYNLTNINITERQKELATIKVLGFFDNEVYRYIFREIDLLALIGSLVGLALGVPLHQFIVRTVEMDQMMFIRSIAPRSYLFSVALTLFFTVVVCRLMRRHVRNISMVESMKAPE